MNERGGLVFYDGVCGFCDQTVQRLLEADREKVLTFAPLQGKTASALLERHPEAREYVEKLKGLLYVQDFGKPTERVYYSGDAATRIALDLGGWWTLTGWLRWLPRPLCNAFYNMIAQRRYRWFGKLEKCRVPDAALRARFLE